MGLYIFSVVPYMDFRLKTLRTPKYLTEVILHLSALVGDHIAKILHDRLHLAVEVVLPDKAVLVLYRMVR